MRILFSVFLVFVVASCATLDRPNLSQFEVLSHNKFKMSAKGTPFYREKEHLEWIEHFLLQEKMCPDGYIIDEKKSTDAGGLNLTHNHYYGTCK